MKKLLLLLALALPIAISGMQDSAQAQTSDTSIGFAISPAILELSGEPGETFSSQLTIANTGSQPKPGFVKSDTLIPIDSILDQGKRSQFDASSWIDIESPNSIFEPNTPRTIDFSVTIPEVANPGAHYALITLSPGIVQNSTRTDTVVVPELSASIFITVAGDIVEQAELVEEDLQIPRLTRNSTSELSFRVRNVGNVHILPAPMLSILKDGKPIEVFAIQPQLILPNTEKTFTVEWKTNVDYGRYGIIAEMTYGNESIPLASTQHEFLVLPSFWTVFLLIVISPLAILLLFRYKNVPRMISVLRGHANYSGRTYKYHAGDQRLPKPSKGTRTISDIAKEIERQPQILGLPDDDYNKLLDEINEEDKPQPLPKPTKKKKKFVSKSQIKGDQTTTFITQTESSTIVRERHQSFNPDDEPIENTPSQKIKISTTPKLAVTREQTKAGKPKKKAAPKKPTKKAPKKPSPKSKAMTKKTASKKKTSSIPAPKNKPATKVSTATPKKKVTKKNPPKKPTKKAPKKPLPKSKVGTKKTATKKKTSTRAASKPKKTTRVKKKSSTGKK